MKKGLGEMTNYGLLEKDVKADGCDLCEMGHRRDGHDHIASQSKGMIPTTPCRAVVAYNLGDATDVNTLPWVVRVNGRLVASRKRVARFGSRESAEASGWQVAKVMFPGV